MGSSAVPGASFRLDKLDKLGIAMLSLVSEGVVEDLPKTGKSLSSMEEGLLDILEDGGRWCFMKGGVLEGFERRLVNWRRWQRSLSRQEREWLVNSSWEDKGATVGRLELEVLSLLPFYPVGGV